MRWETLREEEFEEAIRISNKVCVVPVGCLEMHGEHLPVGTDTFEASYVCNKAAEIEPVMVFPAITFGNVPFLTKSKGAIRLTVELMQALLTQICAEIARNGFKKILLVNGHGGNPALLQNFVSSTQHAKKDYVVMCREDYNYGIPEIVRDLDEGKVFPELTSDDVALLRDFIASGKSDGHAGMDETCTSLVVDPELVKLDRIYAADGIPTGRTDYLRGTGILNGSARFWVVEHPDQYGGHPPVGANARIGKVIMDRRVAIQAEVNHLLKMDDRILDWNDEWNHSW